MLITGASNESVILASSRCVRRVKKIRQGGAAAGKNRPLAQKEGEPE